MSFYKFPGPLNENLSLIDLDCFGLQIGFLICIVAPALDHCRLETDLMMELDFLRVENHWVKKTKMDVFLYKRENMNCWQVKFPHREWNISGTEDALIYVTMRCICFNHAATQ